MARQVRSLKTREEVVAYTNLVAAIINLLVGIWTVASKVMEDQDPTPPRDTQNQGSYLNRSLGGGYCVGVGPPAA